MNNFLYIQTTKDTVIRDGIAIFKYIYNTPGTMGKIRYNMLLIRQQLN